MKCVEYFYNEGIAREFLADMLKEAYNTEAEMIQTIDEDTNEKCWVVYFNPKPMR